MANLNISETSIDFCKEILDNAIETGFVDENGKKVWLDKPIIGILVQENGDEYPIYLNENVTHMSLNAVWLQDHFIGKQARISTYSIGGTLINRENNLYKAIKEYNKDHDFETGKPGWSHDQIVVLCYNRNKFEAVYPA